MSLKELLNKNCLKVHLRSQHKQSSFALLCYFKFEFWLKRTQDNQKDILFESKRFLVVITHFPLNFTAIGWVLMMPTFDFRQNLNLKLHQTRKSDCFYWTFKLVFKTFLNSAQGTVLTTFHFLCNMWMCQLDCCITLGWKGLPGTNKLSLLVTFLCSEEN
jgi:hypothetical protein